MSKIVADLSAVTTVSIDLAKHIFQVHAVDASGRVIVARALRRGDVLSFFASLPPCLVGMEAMTVYITPKLSRPMMRPTFSQRSP